MADKIKFYLDEMMSRDVARGPAARGFEAILAVDLGMRTKDDPEHLELAAQRGEVVVTLDRPFANLTSARTDHLGLICWTGGDSDIGGMVRQLSTFADTHTSEAVVGQVFWLK